MSFESRETKNNGIIFTAWKNEFFFCIDGKSTKHLEWAGQWPGHGYQKLCAKRNFYLCPLAIPNFGEKDSATSCAAYNYPTPNRRSGQPLIFGFETIRSTGTCIQLFTTTSSIFFFGVCKKSDNWDPMIKRPELQHCQTKTSSWLLTEEGDSGGSKSLRILKMTR